MQIKQTTDKSIINWQGYSIGANEKVQYTQPCSGSISLNRVIGQDPSLIYGQLSANGQVWVINPNGLLIGKGASINVGSFFGSTLNINDNDFMNGNYKFINITGSLSSITNQGNITAADGGYVVLIAPSITNEGSITANSGKAYLASADEVTLSFAGNDLIGFTIDKATAKDALGIKNTGTITADGGQVILSAKAATDLLKTVINNEGIIQAQTIDDRSGKIYLLGGMENNAIKVGGMLDASAPNGGDGGFIETSAAKVSIADNAKITTYAPTGKTGTWLIDPNDYTIAASGGDRTGTLLSADLGSNNVTILSSDGGTSGNGDIFVNDAVSWSANTSLTLSAYRNVDVNSNITATGNTAGLVLTPDTCGAACVGTYSLNNGAVITLSGSSPSLTIAGNAYTVINSATALQNMSSNLSGRYALGSNIDASDTSTWNSDAGFVPVGNNTAEFTGTFDGLNHTITDLTINRPTTDYVGLFGYAHGAISNVGLVGGSVTGNNYVGGLAGTSAATITNSYSTGAVTGSDEVGGLVGDNRDTITDSYSTGSVSGNDNVGGLVGSSAGGTITDSYSTGSVTGSGNRVGGLVGDNSSPISSSYASGSVNGVQAVGGLVGLNNWSGTITNSYSIGAVGSSSSTFYVGGLVGYNWNGTITKSYSTGSVTGNAGVTNIGGLVGLNTGTISNSFYDSVTSGQSDTGKGTPKTTGEMMAQANFTGFDFTSGSPVWWMSEGNTRPFLRSEYNTNIVNAHQLQLMALNLGASYTLGADINMAELSRASGLWNTTKGFVPVGDNSDNFTGTLDGLNHTITDLIINRSDTDYVGLFGYTLGATISNIGLVGGSVTGNNYVGGLAGTNDNSTITNSYNTGAVTGGSDVGGLVGDNSGSITNSHATGAVTGTYDVGGLVGYNDGTITSSYATGNADGSGADSDYVGGLVGQNYGTITSSYATGAVTGDYDIGGLVGYWVITRATSAIPTQ
jgi:filamentous hemagglutinin family protein